MAEYFGTQPSDAELPETLPAGTRACYALGDGHRSEPGLTAFTELRLVPPYYVGGWHHDDGKLGNSSPTASVTPRAIHWASVRKQPLLPAAEQMPEGVAELLAEARKYWPEAVVEKRRSSFVVWRSVGDGWHSGVPQLRDIHYSSAFQDGTGGCIERSEFAHAFAESRVWPREDAARLLASEPPAPARAAGWVPKVGEMCEGVATTYSRLGRGKRVVGKLQRFDETPESADAFLDCRDEPPDGVGSYSVAVTRASLRPATAPASPPPSNPAGKADPYVEHRLTVQPDGDRYITENRNAERRNERLASLIASPNPLDRLAAHRSRKIGQLLGELDRPSRAEPSRAAKGVRNEFASGRVLDGAPPSWPNEGDE